MIWRIDAIEGASDERYDCMDWIKKDKIDFSKYERTLIESIDRIIEYTYIDWKDIQ